MAPKNTPYIFVFSAVQQLAFNPEEESSCLSLYFKAINAALTKLPRSGMCRSEEMSRHLDYFLQYASQSHLSTFVQEAMQRAHYAGALAYVFLTHQRLSLSQQQAYVESDVYRVDAGQTQFLGRISSEG